MKNKTNIIIAFVVLAIIQIAVSASMIYKYESTLVNGKVYKLRTAPVDPYDAFRGRYVSLSFEGMEIKKPKDLNIYSGQEVNAHLKQGKDGFAYVDSVSLDKPKDEDYVKAVVQQSFASGASNEETIRLTLPIDRYYMEEDKAPQAEIEYNNATNNVAKKAYVTVRVQSGYSVIEELYIDNTPINEYLAKVKTK